MCFAPIRTPDGQKAACRHCLRCRRNRVDCLVGRCLAEKTVSDGVLGITLTYKGDVPSAVTLLTADVQKFVRSLRDAGHKVRYMIAGEYGERKGRAHWHAVLFFKGKVPSLPLGRTTSWKYWPHGHVFVQESDYAGFRYLLKYALKGKQDGNQARLVMSKKPLLGAEFLVDLAQSIAEKRLPLRDGFYYVPGVRDKHGKHRRFHIHSEAARELYCRSYVEAYKNRWGCDPVDTDYLLERFYDPKIRKEKEAELVAAFGRPKVPDVSPRDEIGFLVLDKVRGLGLSCIRGNVLVVHDEAGKWPVSANSVSAATLEGRLQRAGLSRPQAVAALIWARKQWRSDQRNREKLARIAQS